MTAFPEETLNPTASPTQVSPVVEITVSGGSFTSPYFTFHDSEGNSLDPSTNELLLIPGSTYRFINGGVSGSHPFFISDVGRREASTFNIVSEGSPSSGLSSSVPSLEFQLPADFVGTLIYYCVPHTSMTNNFQVFAVIRCSFCSPILQIRYSIISFLPISILCILLHMSLPSYTFLPPVPLPPPPCSVLEVICSITYFLSIPLPSYILCLSSCIPCACLLWSPS